MTIVTTTVDNSGNVLLNALNGTYLIPQAQASAIVAGMLTPAYELAYDSAATGGAILESLDTNSVAPSVLILNAGSATPYTLNDWIGLQDVVLSPINGIPINLTVTGSQNLTFYSTDEGTPPGYTANGNYQVTLVLNDTGNDVVNVGNASGDSVTLGAGADTVTTGTGNGDTLIGGSGANQTLIANGAQATLTDGTGAHQTLEALGGNSTINVDNGPSDTVISQGGNNTINVAAFAGTETINGTSTDTLNLNDYAANATVTHLSSTETQIVFSDTGQIIDVGGITNINYLAPPPPRATTYDNGDANNPYGDASLADILSKVFLIPQGTAIAASVPAPGAWELVYQATSSAIPEVTDASGNAPSVLAFNFLSGNFSVADWAGLQDVVLCSGPGLTIALTVTGSQNLNFYSTDLTVSQLSGTSFNSYVTNLTLADTGNDNVFLGNADGDIVHAGGGTDHISLGVAGTTVGGVGDQIFGGTGANQTLIANLAGATITDGTGTNQTLSALGGNSTVNVVNGASDTVNSQGGNNAINVAAFAGTETITGTSTDTLNFADSFGNATFTHLTNGSEEIHFSDTGQTVYVFGINQASFAGTVEVFPPPTPTTSDLDATDLANLLGSLLDANDASLLETWAANHLPKDGLTPVETNGSTIPFPGLTTLIPDAEGTKPQILIAENQTATGGYTIDTTGLTGLHAIILPDAQDGGYTGVYNTGGTHLTLNGSHAVQQTTITSTFLGKDQASKTRQITRSSEEMTTTITFMLVPAR